MPATTRAGTEGVVDHEDVLLSAKGVSKSFGNVRALHQVDVEVREREVVGLIGPNGSGKTTFFNCVSGFEHIDSGTIRWRGQDVTGWPPQRLARHGVVRTFQHVMLFPGSTIAESIRQAAACAKSWGPRADCSIDLPTPPEEIAELVGLDPNSRALVSDLPHGTQRLIGVATALAARPSLLMLDEPTAGLHQHESEVLATLLLRLRGLGLTTLVIDHHMPFLLGVCDRVLVLDTGTNLVEGTPGEVQSNPDVIRIYLGAAPGHEAA